MFVILFVAISTKFGIYTIVGLNETLVEAKMFIFTHDGANAKFSTS